MNENTYTFPEVFYADPRSSRLAAALIAHTLTSDADGTRLVLSEMDAHDYHITIQIVLALYRLTVDSMIHSAAQAGYEMDGIAVVEMMQQLTAQCAARENEGTHNE